MEQTFAIKGFPSQDEARDIALKLEAKDIACRVVTEPGGIFATLFVAPADSEAASEIIGEDGFDLSPLPNATEGGIVEAGAAVSTEGILPQVSAELDANIAKKRSPWKNLVALGLSLIVFISLGLFRNSIYGIALLVAVIFVHECGHFIGMKLLSYKDVQMFFIPLFGAAVSGTETAPSGVKKAIVSLLGPVPGILIGVGTGIAYLKTRQPLLADATRTFLFLNTFNLLPFHPLDGGRFFDAVLFSRHPKVELGFKVITTLILGWIAVAFKDVIFGAFAFIVFISLRSTYISATVANSVRKQMDDGEDCSSDAVPTRKVEQFVALLLKKLPADQSKPKLIATYITGIWQRIRNRPCPVGPAIALMLCYIFFIMLGVASAFVFEAAAVATEIHAELVTRTLPNGETIRVHVESIRGQKVSETQVNTAGLFDGSQTAWNMFTRNKSKEGYWRNGYWNGEWKFWDTKGDLTEIVEYEMGKPIRYRKLIDGDMRDVPREEWPRYGRLSIQDKSQGIKDYVGQKHRSSQRTQGAI